MQPMNPENRSTAFDNGRTYNTKNNMPVQTPQPKFLNEVKSGYHSAKAADAATPDPTSGMGKMQTPMSAQFPSGYSGYDMADDTPPASASERKPKAPTATDVHSDRVNSAVRSRSGF